MDRNKTGREGKGISRRREGRPREERSSIVLEEEGTTTKRRKQGRGTGPNYVLK